MLTRTPVIKIKSLENDNRLILSFGHVGADTVKFEVPVQPVFSQKHIDVPAHRDSFLESLGEGVFDETADFLWIVRIEGLDERLNPLPLFALGQDRFIMITDLTGLLSESQEDKN